MDNSQSGMIKSLPGKVVKERTQTKHRNAKIAEKVPL
jgi:hypothetical protein